MLNIILNTAQRCFFDPGPRDVSESPAVPGVGPDYLIADPTVLSVDKSGPKPDIRPIRVGSTTVTIRGAVAPGQPYIFEDVSVTVNAGPLDHFTPTADPPRPAA